MSPPHFSKFYNLQKGELHLIYLFISYGIYFSVLIMFTWSVSLQLSKSRQDDKHLPYNQLTKICFIFFWLYLTFKNQCYWAKKNSKIHPFKVNDMVSFGGGTHLWNCGCILRHGPFSAFPQVSSYPCFAVHPGHTQPRVITDLLPVTVDSFAFFRIPSKWDHTEVVFH